MVGGIQPKIIMGIDEDGNLALNDDFMEIFSKEQEHNWKLVRERDGLTRESNAVMWVEWNSNGTVKGTHTTPSYGLSLIMSPFNDFFTWQTTTITELVEVREDFIKFKTKNSNYELFKL